LYGGGQAKTGTLQEYLHSALNGGGADWMWASAAYAASKGQTTADLIEAFKSENLTNWDSIAVVQNELKKVGIPAFAQGTNSVPRDMLAMVHEGEAIIPEPFNPERYGRASGNEALVEEIKALRAQVESLQKSTEAGQNAIAANTSKTARVMTKFDIDGLPATRT
jgi:hypothetical protein